MIAASVDLPRYQSVGAAGVFAELADVPSGRVCGAGTEE
jgi:hypothetical protein